MKGKDGENRKREEGRGKREGKREGKRRQTRVESRVMDGQTVIFQHVEEGSLSGIVKAQKENFGVLLVQA